MININLKNFSISNNSPFVLIAGPCVIENESHSLMIAEELYKICDDVGINLIFKSSFDKANRSSINSDRGIKLDDALKIFEKIKTNLNLPILTDVHNEDQCNQLNQDSIIDILQIPAFLCRQTDLLLAAGNTNKIINVKKGQFLSPTDVKNICTKIETTNNKNIMITERGTSFGYNTLVNDFKGLDIMKRYEYPVIFDATHSVQQPGGLGDKSGGQREHIPSLCKAAISIGVAGLFLESRGNPTVECDIEFENSTFGRAAVPSGASTGVHEALELRDNDKSKYKGKGVLKAVGNINDTISNELVGKSFEDISSFDDFLLELDGTENKSNLGANATLAASLAFAKCLASSEGHELYSFLGKEHTMSLPVPMMNIINGGSHADNDVDIQEFMVAPIGANNFSEALQYGCEIFHSLKSLLKSKGLNTNVGDEGGFAPNINSSSEVIETVLKSVEDAGFKPGKDIYLSLDVASTEFYKNNKYDLQGEKIVLSSDEMIKYLEKLVNAYPIYSIEDGMSEDDWDGWSNLTSTIGKKVQLVGDDLFVTNKKRLQKGIAEGAGNSILVKVNQIGTLKETLESIKLAKENNFTTIISHRSGETEDTTIADLSVGVSAGQIKTGSLSRTDRTAKYNQLLRIEEALQGKANYAGSSILNNK